MGKKGGVVISESLKESRRTFLAVRLVGNIITGGRGVVISEKGGSYFGKGLFFASVTLCNSKRNGRAEKTYIFYSLYRLYKIGEKGERLTSPFSPIL